MTQQEAAQQMLHDWAPESGFCRRCGIGYIQAYNNRGLSECSPDVVGIAKAVMPSSQSARAAGIGEKAA